jgi:PAS domain S-box-containing protein
MQVRRVERTFIYDVGIAAGAAAMGLLFTAGLWEFMQESPFVFFIVGVVFAAWQGGFLAGLFSGALSVLAIDFFLVEPYFNLSATPGDFVRFTILFLVAALLSWLQDQRNRTENSLREIKEELEVILNSVSDGITAKDVTGKLVFANAAAAAITGQKPADLKPGGTLFKRLQDEHKLTDEEDATILETTLPYHRVFMSGKPAETTFGLRGAAADGTRWIQLKSSPVFDRNGKVRLAVNILHDITEKRRLEKVRAESEQRVRRILDNLTAFVGIMTPDGVLVEANRSALEAANLKPADVLGKPFDQTYWWAYDPGIQATLRAAIQRAAAGEVVRYDVPVRLGPDNLITIDFVLAPVFDHAGRVEYLIPSGIDVTARNRLTEQLQLYQHRLESILNSVPGIVFEGFGGDAPMNFISKYVEPILGYPQSEALTDANFWKRVIHPDDWEPALKLAAEIWEAKEARPIPFRCTTADGRVIHTETYIGSITDLAGQPAGVCGIVLDVTERRRQEAEIARLNTLLNYQRQRLSTIIGNVPGIVFEGSGEDGRQRMDFVSAYINKMLGYSPEECMSDPNFWQKVVVNEDWENTLKRSSELIAGGETGTVQFRCTARDGRVVHVEAHSSVIHDNKQRPIGAVGVMMDITERRQIEEAITEYAEDLRRSNEELEQFAYVASHDLQEPLRMVTSYLQLIEHRYGEQLDGDAREFIGYAVDGAARMKRLINDLLAYSRIQRSADEFEPVNMETALEQALYNLQLSVEDTGAVITHDPLPEVTANPVQMTQLLQNLIGNALKFRGDRTPEIHVGVKRERDRWHFSVKDNGIGIESEYLERIFLIFQRLHARQDYPGTGIGLAICKKIVDKHGGEIYAGSTPGEGTTFHFTIPVKRSYRRIIRGSDPHPAR